MLAAIRPPKTEAVAAAPAKAAEGPPAPITPPDFNADYLNNPAPRYPVESRRLREQGTVAIKVLVGPEGTVQELKLAESSGHSRLDKRSEEHTSELQSLMRISYAVFCLKKKNAKTANNNHDEKT